MRVCFAINVWRRPRVFRNVLRSIRAQETGRKIEIVCALSPDDPDLLTNERTCIEFDAHWIRTTNSPLSNKANALTKFSSNIEWGYQIRLGSDDVLSSNFVDATIERANEHGWGWEDCYFWVPSSERFVHWAGYGARRRESVGAGRALSRDVLERLDWQTHDPGITQNLDKSMTDRLAAIGVEIPFGPMPDGVYLVDCKDEHSITALDDFEQGKLVDVPVPESIRGYL